MDQLGSIPLILICVLKLRVNHSHHTYAVPTNVVAGYKFEKKKARKRVKMSQIYRSKINVSLSFSLKKKQLLSNANSPQVVWVMSWSLSLSGFTNARNETEAPFILDTWIHHQAINQSNICIYFSSQLQCYFVGAVQTNFLSTRGGNTFSSSPNIKSCFSTGCKKLFHAYYSVTKM